MRTSSNKTSKPQPTSTGLNPPRPEQSGYPDSVVQSTSASTPATGGNSHRCDACGGAGYSGHCGCWYSAWEGSDCAHLCPVCDGEGSFSDQMPASDALADAETLRNVVDAQRYPIDAFDWVRYPDLQALRCGISTDPRGAGLWRYSVQTHVDDARFAARLAFWAAPALRGEA